MARSFDIACALAALFTVVVAGGCAADSGALAGDDGGAQDDGSSASDPDGGAGADGGAAAGTPVLAQVAYYRGANAEAGPRMLFRGTDPGDALTALRIEFLDDAARPTTVDLDGDGIPDDSQLDVSAIGTSTNGAFFFELASASTFERAVQGIRATPWNRDGIAGTAVTAMLLSTPLRALGESCDPQGFDVCDATSACAPGLVTTPNHCASAAALRADRCAAAPSIDATTAGQGGAGAVTIAGRASGVSLDDPPIGCAANDIAGRPEAVVRLHVASHLAALTLDTADPATTFDTVVYVLPACDAPRDAAIACNDDDPSPTSRVAITDVAPGDYIVVVDSLSRDGGAFVLHATFH